MDIYFLAFNAFILAFIIFVNSASLTLLIISYFSVTAYRRRTIHQKWRQTIQSPVTIGVSVIVPAYNESASIANSVRSMLLLQYPKFEVIVVNDGSSDDTMAVLVDAFRLEPVPLGFVDDIECQPILGLYRSPINPALIVLDKANGGKAEALNAGINVATQELICAVDADSLLEGEALLRVTKPFLDDGENTVAVGGIVRVVNGCTVASGRVVEARAATFFWAIMQTMEYLRAFLFGRSGLAALRSLIIVSGAFGVFRRDIVAFVGGYRVDTVGEDIELIVRIHQRLRKIRRDYKILFLPDPICWTQVPESMKVLARQRNRWHRGLIDTLRIHKRLFMNPRYGAIGLVGFPYFVFVEMLGTLVELFGYLMVTVSYLAGLLDMQFFGLFMAMAIIFGGLVSTCAVVLEEITFRRFPRTKDLLKLVAASFVESFGYRQLSFFWRLQGTWDYLRGVKEWGRMERTGFSPS